MAKGGLLQTLAPILGIGAALAAPEILPAVGLGEAAGGAGAAATLADTAGGIAPEAILAAPEGGLAGAATGVATPLAADALAAIPELGAAEGGLLAADTVGGAVGGAGGAVPSLGEATGGLLGAGQAAAPVPLADTAAAAAPVDTGVMTATPAAPSIPGVGLPPGITPTPDLTVAGGLPGPVPGETVNMFATSADTAGAAGDAATSFIPGTDTLLSGAGESLPPLDVTGGGIGDFASKAGNWALAHPGALLLAGLGGEQLLKGNPSYPAEQSIQGLANPLGAQGASAIGAGVSGLQGQAATTAGETAALTAPLTTGILPPGLQQGVDQATQAQKAQVRSTYAAQGLSGSTMEADKLAQVDANAASQKASIAEGLLPAAEQFSQQTGQAFTDISRAGATLSGMSLDAYNTLLKTQMQSDQNYQAALYKFAAALASGGYQPPAANA